MNDSPTVTAQTRTGACSIVPHSSSPQHRSFSGERCVIMSHTTLLDRESGRFATIYTPPEDVLHPQHGGPGIIKFSTERSTYVFTWIHGEHDGVLLRNGGDRPADVLTIQAEFIRDLTVGDTLRAKALDTWGRPWALVSSPVVDMEVIR